MPASADFAVFDKKLRELMENLASAMRQIGESPKPDDVHDLRVAIRRLEQALKVCKGQLPRTQVKALRRRLKDLFSKAGSVRDYDIAGELLLERRSPANSGLKPRIRASRKRAAKNLRSALQRRSLLKRVSRWYDNLAGSGGLKLEPPPVVAGKVLPRLAELFFQKGELAAASGPGKQLHKFRIQSKEFRYTLELFLSVYGSEGEEWIREIKELQTALGDINDCRTVLSMADELDYGHKVEISLRNSELRKIRQFRKIWARQFSRSAAERWIAKLRAPAESRPVRKPVIRSASVAKPVIMPASASA